MKWSLSEFLNLIELRSQAWCTIGLGGDGGFRIAHSEAVLFYVALEGRVRISGVRGGRIDMEPGDIVMILSGDAHAIRVRPDCQAELFPFLNDSAYADTPPAFSIGQGQVAARLLCGRIKPRWPGGQQPRALPPMLRAASAASIFNIAAAADAVQGSGAVAVLTRMAGAIFVDAFRAHPDCQTLFSDASTHQPIARACHYIQLHPFSDWTVESLARKVGMGRSNFAARFVSEVGKTPMEALAEERMQHAARFLEETDLKVSEISERVGYRSEAAFSRRFTSHFGTSPSRMRRQMRVDG
jgi:AraC-like DNA-binding protein